MNKELLEAMEVLEKEKNISKDTMIEAIENSLITACKNNFGKADNVKVVMNRTTGDFAVYAEKTVVEEVEDPVMEISLADARMISAKYQLGDTVGAFRFQKIRTYRNPERKECDPSEDPRRRAQGIIQ